MSGAIPTVLVVGNFLSGSTGIPGICEELSQQLSDHGWRVVSTSRRSNPMARGLDMVATTVRSLRSVDVAQVEVYSGRAFLWAEAVTAVLRGARVPHIVTTHGGDLPRLARRWPRRLRRVLSGASGATAPSTFLARELASCRADIQVIRNGIEIDRYPFQLRMNPRPRLVWLRAFHRIYNPQLAVEVASKLVREHADLELTMIGPDKKDGSLERVRRTISERGLTAHVRTMGAIPKRDVPKSLASADVFINTSSIDNAPVTLVEPMACGLCVVTTDAGGIPDLATHGRDALIVPVGDADAMAGQVARILADAPLAASLSRASRATATCHDWSLITSQWDQLLRKVAGLA